MTSVLGKIKKSINDEFRRLKGDKHAITAIILLGMAVFAIAGGEGYHFTTLFLDNYGAKKTIALILQIWFLYSAPYFAFLIFLEDGYKTKHHKMFFAVSMLVAIAFKTAVIFINQYAFSEGFTDGFLPLLFSLELLFPVLLCVTALACVTAGKWEKAVRFVSAVAVVVSALNLICHLSYCVIDIRTVLLYAATLFESCAYFVVAEKIVKFRFVLDEAEDTVSEQMSEVKNEQ